MDWKSRTTDVGPRPSPRRRVVMMVIFAALVVGCGAVAVKALAATSRAVTSSEIRAGERNARRQYGQWYNMWNPSVRQSGSRTIRIYTSPGTLTSYGGGSVRYSSSR